MANINNIYGSGPSYEAFPCLAQDIIDLEQNPNLENSVLRRINSLVNVNQDYNGQPLLYYALKSKNQSVIYTLLNKEAKPTEECLKFCVSLEMAEQFYPSLRPCTPRARTLVYDLKLLFGGNLYQNLAQMLLFWEGDINARMEGGNTLMHHVANNFVHSYAQRGGHLVPESSVQDLMNAILKLNPDLEIENDKGLTPFTSLISETDGCINEKSIDLIIQLVEYATPNMLDIRVKGKTIDEMMLEIKRNYRGESIDRMMELYKEAKIKNQIRRAFFRL